MGLTGVASLLPKADILNAITSTRGLVRKAAKKLGVNHSTLYAYMHRDEEIRAHVEECRAEYQYQCGDTRLEDDEEILAEAYKAILSLVKSKNVNAVLFVLKEKGNWDKALKLQAANNQQTLVYQVNGTAIEKVDDKKSDSVGILSEVLSAADTKSS